MVSLGGALGAVLVAIVAPLVLIGYFELDIALVAARSIMRAGGADPLARRSR